MAAVWMDIFKDEIDERMNAREQDTIQPTIGLSFAVRLKQGHIEIF